MCAGAHPSQTHPSRINITSSATVHLKLDGSLVSPFLAPGAGDPTSSRLHWATRRALCPEVAEFVVAFRSQGAASSELSPTGAGVSPRPRPDYEVLCTSWLKRGWTPLFEWCDARRAAGAIRHLTSSLVLLTLRNNESGAYLSHAQVAAAAVAADVPFADALLVHEVLAGSGRVPTVVWAKGGDGPKTEVASGTGGLQAASCADNGKLPIHAVPPSATLIERLQAAVALWDGVEGAVLSTVDCASGGAPSMLKLKSHWWLELTAAYKDAPSCRECDVGGGSGRGAGVLLSLLRRRPTLAAVPASVVWSACLSPMRDDMLPRCAALLREAGGKSGGIETGEADARRLQAFGARVDTALIHLQDTLRSWATEATRRIRAAKGQGQHTEKAVRKVLQQAATRAGWSRATALHLTATSRKGAEATSKEGDATSDEDSCLGDWWEAALQQLRSSAEEGGGAIGHLETVLRVGWTASRPFTSDIVRADQGERGQPRSARSAAVAPLPRGIEPSGPLLRGWRVYCDLDGVLADFDRRARHLLGGRDPSAVRNAELWAAVDADPKFFEQLDWTEGGRDLWTFLTHPDTGIHKLSLLTGLPFGTLGQRARRQKAAWCARELGTTFQVVCCMSREKHRHAGQRAILIDDRDDIGKAWTKAGGTFVHHVSTAQTIAALLHIGQANSSPRALRGAQESGARANSAHAARKGGRGQRRLRSGRSGGRYELAARPAGNDGSRLDSVNNPDSPANTSVGASPCKAKCTPSTIAHAVGAPDAADQQDGCGVETQAPPISDAPAALSCLSGASPFLEAPTAVLEPRVVYAGVFLDEPSVCLLRSMFPPVHATVASHPHITLIHEPDMQCLRDCVAPLLGERCVFCVQRHAADERGQAVGVSIDDARVAELCLNTHPHITISTAAGTSPVYSNELLASMASHSSDGVTATAALAQAGVAEVAQSESALLTLSGVVGLMLSPGVASKKRPGERKTNNSSLSPGCVPHGRSEAGSGSGNLARPATPSPARKGGRWVVDNRAVAAEALPGLSDALRPPQAAPGEWLELKDALRRLADGLQEGSNADLLRRLSPLAPSELDRLARESTRMDGLGRAGGDADTLKVAYAGIDLPEDNSGESDGEEGGAWDLLEPAKALGSELSVEMASLMLDPIRADCDEDERVGMDAEVGSRGLVVIMRGLPGSGKSSACRALASAWENEMGRRRSTGTDISDAPANASMLDTSNCATVTCSADSYFDAGAGVLSRRQLRIMSRKEAYLASFDKGRLQAAHQWCRQRFECALSQGVPLVLVDNTNSQAWEYQYYKRQAKRRGYQLAVLELGCDGEQHARQLCARSAHQVPWEVVVRMMQQWETDVDAVILPIQRLAATS